MRRTSAETIYLIQEVATERFAADGYERTTIRAVAADAGIDPALVMRYFGSKERLFASAVEILSSSRISVRCRDAGWGTRSPLIFSSSGRRAMRCRSSYASV